MYSFKVMEINIHKHPVGHLSHMRVDGLKNMQGQQNISIKFKLLKWIQFQSIIWITWRSKPPQMKNDVEKVMFLQMQFNYFGFHKEPFSEQFLVRRVF